MIRRRDVIIGLSVAALMGCDPQAPGSETVAPGIPRAPRADRLACGGAGIGQLRADALWVRGPDGAHRAELPFESTYGLTALADGTLVALGRKDGKNMAVIVDPAGTASWHPVWVVTGEEPIALLPAPEGFWILSPDRKTAVRTSLVEKYGMLGEVGRVSLDNGAMDDVVAVGDDLVFHHLDSFRRVDPKGVETRVPWAPKAAVERLALGPSSGTAWALGVDGALALVDLPSGAVRVQSALTGQGVALASDTAGVAAITASRPPGGEAQWTLTVQDAAGAAVSHAEGEGDPPRSLCLSADQVVAGDGARLWIWGRRDGKLMLQEG